MSSINTNTSAMNALSTLRQINKDLESTQGRISTGLSVQSGKDNAAYFSISETMSGDSSTYSSINEGLTLTKNSIATARLGTETIQDLAQQFLEKVSFAQGATGGQDEIEADLAELVKQMETTLSQSTFNGDDMLGAGSYNAMSNSVTAVITGQTVNSATGVLTAATNAAATSAGGLTVGVTRDVVTGISRAGGAYATTEIAVDTHDVASLVANFKALSTNFGANAAKSSTGAAFLAQVLTETESQLSQVTDIATKLGQSEKSIENQQDFLTAVVDNIDAGVGAMIDADMEEEAARLQALQVQQQLATQSLSIANSSPQNILSLFQ